MSSSLFVYATGNWQLLFVIAVLFGVNVALLRAMRRYKTMAFTSKLGILNRRGLVSVTQPLMARFRRHEIKRICVAVIDIDNMKALNSALGYRGTDKVLSHCASILVSGVRETDIVAHIHGDEFVVVFTDTTDEYAKKVLDRANMRLRAIEPLFLREYSELRLSFTYGVVSAINPSQSLEELFDEAETLLKVRKKQK